MKALVYTAPEGVVYRDEPAPDAFGELIAIRERNLIALPEGLEPVYAALTEPAGTALHALTLAGWALHRPIAEGRALVLGGGSIGLLPALMLHARGCRDIVLGDTNALRRATAEKAGVCQVYDPLEGPGPAADASDLVVDAVGASATRASALDWVEQRPLKDGARAFDDLDKGRLAAAKLVLWPG